MLTEGAGDLGSREFNKALEEKAIRLNTGVAMRTRSMWVPMEDALQRI